MMQTADDVLARLEGLEPWLIENNLRQFVFFNRAYVVITKAINNGVKHGVFEHPVMMERLEMAFASRYFDALDMYGQQGKLPAGWNRLISAPSLASLALMLGANAHINYDLQSALREVVDEPHLFEHDYFQVNELLLASSQSIVDSYHEPDETMNMLKEELRSMYIKPIMGLILRWRRNVWQNFMQSYAISPDTKVQMTFIVDKESSHV